jgi:hypothetical protein
MIESIFRHIDRVYGLELEVDIQDFLISSDMCVGLGQDAARAAVLVREGQSGEEIELGVYIGEEALDQLREIDLTTPIRPESFELLVTAIEEVSHFAYLHYSATRERRVTQLELELQAEVDKFIITWMLLLASRNDGRVTRNLLDRLFGDFEIRPELEPVTRERYKAAASLASRYCTHVVQAALSPDRLSALLPELRSFYRLTQRGKIGRIHNIVYAA